MMAVSWAIIGLFAVGITSFLVKIIVHAKPKLAIVEIIATIITVVSIGTIVPLAAGWA